MVRSHWGKHYRAFKRGVNNASNSARQIRNFIEGLDSAVGNLGLPDTLSREQGGSARSVNQSHKDNLARARDLLQIERDRAINKIYKMATSPDGADIRGTKYDPIGKSAIGRVTLKNAKVELERLSEFNNSNSVWYHSDAKGNPISDKDVRRYRDAVRRYNESIDAYERSVGGTNIPFLGDVTVSDWIRDFRPKKVYLPGGSSYALEHMSPHKRTSSFDSAESMRLKTDQILHRMTKKGQQQRLTSAKQQIAAMLDAIGDLELYDILTDIPDDVLWLMWTVNDHFANQISLMYEAAKEGYYDRKSQMQDLWYDDVENANSEIKTLLSEIYMIKIKPEDDFSGSPVNKRAKRRRKARQEKP